MPAVAPRWRIPPRTGGSSGRRTSVKETSLAPPEGQGRRGRERAEICCSASASPGHGVCLGGDDGGVDVERAPRQGGGKRVGGEVGAQESSADRIKSDASVTLRCTRSRSGRPVAVSSSPAMK